MFELWYATIKDKYIINNYYVYLLLFTLLFSLSMGIIPNVSNKFFFSQLATITIASLTVIILYIGNIKKTSIHRNYHIIIYFILTIWICTKINLKNGNSIVYAMSWLCTLGIAFLLLATRSASLSNAIRASIRILVYIESTIVILQYIHLLPSLNSLFSATGTLANPNTTALFVAMSLPLYMRNSYFNINHKSYGFIPLLAIILLQSRTAYLITIIYFLVYSDTTFLRKWVASLFLFGLLIYTFTKKSGSNTGRLIVWNNCIKLINAHPWIGYGNESFEYVYNQSVAKNSWPSQGHVNMAYNDFLQTIIEQGLPFTLVWIIFLIILFIRRYRTGKSTYPVIAFIIIQMVNFGFSAIPLFFLFIVSIYNEENIYPRLTNHINKLYIIFNKGIAGIVCLTIFFYALSISILEIGFQKAYKHKDKINAQKYSKSLYSFSTYWQNMGNLYCNEKDYISAIPYYLRAINISSGIDLYLKLGFCYMQSGSISIARYYITLASHLSPQMMTPYFLLLKCSEHSNQAAESQFYAKKIIHLQSESVTPEIKEMKQYAITVLKKYELK